MIPAPPKTFIAAAVQASPIFFDLGASLAKALALIKEAAAQGATLIVFPEVFLPGYPFFIWLESYGEWVAKRQDYHLECPLADGPEYLALVNIAKELQVTIVMGCSEREHGTLYMGQWIVGPEGVLLQRRKLKPTLMERVIFGEGDGSDIRVCESTLGRIGALNCWEHNIPLIKHVMACQHEEIHCASWPHLHDGMPHFSLGLTANSGSNRAYAIEVGTFVVMATAPISEQDAQYLCGDDQDKRRMLSLGGGASMIYDPEGRELSEKLDSASEGIIYAEIDVAKAYLAKSALDIVGHYARSDIFQVLFDAHPRSAMTARPAHGSPLATGSNEARQSRQTAFERMEVIRPANPGYL